MSYKRRSNFHVTYNCFLPAPSFPGTKCLGTKCLPYFVFVFQLDLVRLCMYSPAFRISFESKQGKKNKEYYNGPVLNTRQSVTKQHIYKK